MASGKIHKAYMYGKIDWFPMVLVLKKMNTLLNGFVVENLSAFSKQRIEFTIARQR